MRKQQRQTPNSAQKQTLLLRFVACSSGSNSNNFENEKKGKKSQFSSIYELLGNISEPRWGALGTKNFQT